MFCSIIYCWGRASGPKGTARTKTFNNYINNKVDSDLSETVISIIHSTAHSKSTNMVALISLPPSLTAMQRTQCAVGCASGEEHGAKGTASFTAKRKQASVSANNYSGQQMGQKTGSISMAGLPWPTLLPI